MTIKNMICAAVISALPAFAQAAAFFEGEAFLNTGPSDTTATAQDIGTLYSSGIQVLGSRLDSEPGSNTADFYKFIVSGPTQVAFAVTVPTGAASIDDPVLGLYASNGLLISKDDDSGGGYNSFLSQNLSAGTYFAAVSGYSDFTFAGASVTRVPPS